jgi:hypothetical protein
MSNVLAHRFVSARADGADATQVQPSHWNDGHKFTGGAADELLVRDPTDTNFGAKWVASPSVVNLTASGLITGRDVTRISSTATGTQNDWNPGIVKGTTYIEWAGASALTVTGIAGGFEGSVLIFKAAGAAAPATFAHASASSAVGARFSNIASSGPTPVANLGYAIWVHNGTYWVLVSHDQGSWITPAFSAANYTAFSAGTWTVEASDIGVLRYVLHGKTLSVQLAIDNTTVVLSGGQPTFLVIATAGVSPFMPTVFTNLCLVDNNNLQETGLFQFNGANYLISRLGGGVFTAATNTSGVFAHSTFEVN